MADRRMFAKTIVLSDAFLDMPMSSRCLYFTLSMLADDDGFVNQPRAIMRQCGASEDDIRMLIAKKFVIVFESGVIVIKHWRINNYLRSDRYKETVYKDEKEQLELEPNGSYHFKDGIPSMGKPSLGKVSIGKVNNKRFVPPTEEQVRAYCQERHNKVDVERFVDYYTANGWVQGKGKPIKDWKACVRTWERNTKQDKTVIPMPEYIREQINDEVVQEDTSREINRDQLLKQIEEMKGNFKDD